MPGAAIVRWQSGEAIVLALHGAFDGASAWALRNDMDESSAREFIIDLTQVVEAYDFAASVLASWARANCRDKRVRFTAAEPEHARLLVAHGLEVVDEEASGALAVPFRIPFPPSPEPSGASA